MNLGPESETAERKRSTSELKEGAASVAAILNKHGRGELFFGARNDGEVRGMQASDSTLREVSQAIGHSIEPRVYSVVEALGDGEGRSCIRVSFSGDDAPYACKGVYPHARLGRGRPHERRLSIEGKKPALFHARSYGGTGHAVVVEGYFQAIRKSDGQSLSVIQVADGWYSGVRYLNFYHSGLTNRTATLLC